MGRSIACGWLIDAAGDDRRRTQHRERTRAHRAAFRRHAWGTQAKKRTEDQRARTGHGSPRPAFDSDGTAASLVRNSPSRRYRRTNSDQVEVRAFPKLLRGPAFGVRTRGDCPSTFRCLRRRACWCGEGFRAVAAEPQRRSEPRARYRRNRECSPIRMTECPSAPRRLDLRGPSAQEFPHLRNRGMRANQVGDCVDSLVHAGGGEVTDGVEVVREQ